MHIAKQHSFLAKNIFLMCFPQVPIISFCGFQTMNCIWIPCFREFCCVCKKLNLGSKIRIYSQVRAEKNSTRHFFEVAIEIFVY